MIAPSNNPLTPGYGFGSILPPYSNTNPHKGQDFRYDPDHTVYMPEDGNITQVKWDGLTKEGNMVIVTAGANRHALCHLFRFLAPNGFYKQGTAIGIMGSTGQAVGAHLHWTLRINGILVDPIKQIGGGTMPPVTATDKQIDETINAGHFAAFGVKPEQVVYDTYRPLLKNNYVEGNLTMLKQFYEDPNSLANKPSDFVPVGQLYAKKG